MGPAINVSPSEYLLFPPFAKQRFFSMPVPSAGGGRMTVNVDMVIYADGTYAGADHSLLLERYRAITDAQHEISESVLQLLNANAAVGDILSTLGQDSAVPTNPSIPPRPGVDPTHDPAREYASQHAFQTRQIAEQLLGAYRRGGLGALKQLATAMAEAQPTLAPITTN